MVAPLINVDIITLVMPKPSNKLQKKKKTSN
jgi:hypothetical protein